MKVLKPSQIQPGMKSSAATGDSQPPRNMVTHRIETSHMFAYSARKNIAKLMPEYSIMCPATISDSPSTTSKGARFVSARPDMKYTRKIGSSGSQFHENRFSPMLAPMPRDWLMPTSVMLSE